MRRQSGPQLRLWNSAISSSTRGVCTSCAGSTQWVFPTAAPSSRTLTPERGCARLSPSSRRLRRALSERLTESLSARMRGPAREAAMHEMVIYGVSFDLVGKQPIVLLKTADGNKFLPIWIGHPEPAAIPMKLKGASTPRPMTHDLITDMLGQLDAQVTRITVTELKENTFYASITVQQDGSEIEIDSRPSDAIALAVRADAPIFAADSVIEESAIEFEGEEVNEEEIVSEFKKFLDNVTPDEFAVEGEEGDDA